MPLSDDELEIVKTTAEGAVKGLVEALAGEALQEARETLGLQIRFLKIRRAARLAKKVQELLAPIGINRRPVALKLLLPSLDHAGVEDDDELQDCWARLLATAADASQPEVHPSFPEILRQLTARDAKLLMLMSTMTLELKGFAPYEPVKIAELRERSGACGFDPSDDGAYDFYVSAETLVRLRLTETETVSRQSGIAMVPGSAYQAWGAYLMTNLGWAFLKTVTPPDLLPKRPPLRPESGVAR